MRRGGRGVGRRRAARPIRWRCGTRRGGRPGRRGCPSAIERWVLPVPGGPSRTTFSLPARKSSWPRCRTASRLIERLEGEVELLERLARREARGLDAGLAAVAVAAVGLGLQQRRGELLIAPFLGAGAVGELGQRPRRGRRLERAEQVRELGRGRLMRSARRSGPAAGPRPRSRPARRGRSRSARACSSAVIVRCARERRARAGRRARRCPARPRVTSRWSTRTSTRRPTSARVERVVVGVEAQVADRAGPACTQRRSVSGIAPAAAPSPRARRRAGRPGGRAASCACAR